MKILWHIGNVIFGSIIGLFLLALIPSISARFESGTTTLFGCFFAYIPFFIVSIRSGKKTINFPRHIIHSFLGFIISFAMVRMPFLEGDNFISWLVVISLCSLFTVSLVSGRKVEDKKRNDI